jgi:hypothetical protein
VTEIAGKTIGTGQPGALTKKLDGVFESYVKEYVERRLATSR